MRQLNVFVLLPEVTPLHDFFHTAYDFVEETALIAFLKELKASIEWAYREKHTETFYSIDNVRRFLDCFEDFQEDYLIDPVSILDDILNEAENWQQNQQQEQKYAYHILEGQATHPVTHHVLAEIAERKRKKAQQAFVLLNYHAATFRFQQIALFKMLHQDNIMSVLPTFEAVNTQSQLYKWLIDNRYKRNFNLNPKHGENGIAAHKSNKGEEVSLLLCNRIVAQELLKTAIGDVRQTIELYNFDTIHQRFIVFKFENETPQNQYHGYHPNNQNEVPEYFKQLIEMVK